MTADRLRKLLAEAPTPAHWEMLTTQLAVWALEARDALAKHSSAVPHGQYVNHAEADALLAAFDRIGEGQ